MNPLLVCCSYPPKQMIDLGAANLSNLISCGFDVEVFNPAPETAAKLSLEGFQQFGNVCKASEIALFSAVPRIAIERGIRLIFYGENPALQEGDSATLGVDEFDAIEKFFSQLQDRREDNNHQVRAIDQPCRKNILIRIF